VMPTGMNGKFGGRARAVGSDGTIYTARSDRIAVLQQIAK
jgi:hypothetical protein